MENKYKLSQRKILMNKKRFLMKNLSIGVDIEDIASFTKIDNEKDHLFFYRIFTQKEIEYCFSKSNHFPHFAVRFAGKEAVIKVISGFGEKISSHEIEILNDINGAPLVSIKNNKFSDVDILIKFS